MARPPRIDFPDALYHVTSRGNGRSRIFRADDDRRRFVAQLQDNLDTFAVVCYAYVLMDNHFHLLVRTPRANLSQFMQRLKTSYALYARYKHRKPGHQFEARFKAKLVQDDSYLLVVTRYIHLNPIKTAACKDLDKPELVRRLEAYRWGSYRGYVAAKNAEDFVCYDVLERHGSTPAAARRRYRSYVRACVLEDDEAIIEAMRTSAWAIGDESFVEKTKRRLQTRRTGSARDRDLALPPLTVDIEALDACVAGHYRIGPEDLSGHGRRVGDAKFVAVELACRLCGMTGREVGAHYGGISSAAVSIIRRNIREGKYDVGKVVQRLLTKIRRDEA